MLGQVSKDMKEVKETLAMLTSKENSQQNSCYGKSNKQEGPANQKPKHAAHKAKPGREEKKAPKAFKTSDDGETEEEAPNTEETIYRAYRATVMQPERRDESPLYVRKPFGISTRPSSVKDFDRMRQLMDGPPDLTMICRWQSWWRPLCQRFREMAGRLQSERTSSRINCCGQIATKNSS
jgi:hypothetical protein